MALSQKSMLAADNALAELESVPPSDIEDVLARIRANHSTTYAAAQAAKQALASGTKPKPFEEGSPESGGFGPIGSRRDPNEV